MDEAIYKKLTAPFSIYEKPGTGKKFKYIKSKDVIDRMCDIFDIHWSTEILSSEVLEDTVVVKVKVTVYEFIDSAIFPYSHDGYGSDTIKRFSSGSKEGQPIDLGNSYKSAETKAIAHACSRFGVGLFLEEEEDHDTVVTTEKVASTTSTFTPFNIPSFTNGPKEEFSKEAFPKVSLGIPESSKPIETASISPTFTQNNKPTNVVSIPGAGSIVMPSFSINMPTSSKVEAPKFINTVKMDGPANDVQKTAIESLLAMHSISYSTLVGGALQVAENMIPLMDELTYDQCVRIIRYGNESFRQNKK